MPLAERTALHGGHANMHVTMIDWNDLRFVLAVAEHGSLTAASRALDVHQTTVGRRIEALEQELGQPLFLRTPRGLAPLPEASRLLGAIGSVAGSLQRLERGLAGEGATLAGLVRLAVTENTARILLREALPELARSHPEIVIELMSGNRVVDLSRGEADVAIRVTQPDDPDLIAKRLGWVRYALFGSARYLAAHPAATTDGLEGHAVLLPSAPLDAGPEAIWLGTHAASARVGLRAGSHVSLALAAERDMGLVVLPTNLAVLHPELVLVRTLPALGPRAAWLVMHRDARRVARVRLVADRAAEAVRKALA